MCFLSPLPGILISVDRFSLPQHMCAGDQEPGSILLYEFIEAQPVAVNEWACFNNPATK